jgi:hypothetical protein
LIRKLAALVLLAAAVPWIQAQVDERTGPFRKTSEVLYLWSGEQVARLVPGFRNLAADLYWMRTVQYFGGQRHFPQGKNFDLLYPLVDIATTLDPRLEIAYRYGAVFLCEPRPGGAGQPHEGIALLEKGSRLQPGNWRIRQDLGFFTFLFLHDAKSASRILMEAAQIPGAAFWLRSLAADTLVQGGRRQDARRMWQTILETSSDIPILRANAETRLKNLDAQDEAEAIERLVSEFAARRGRLPADLQELVGAGLLRGPAVDPAGVPFAYDPASGSVTLAPVSPLWRPS